MTAPRAPMTSAELAEHVRDYNATVDRPCPTCSAPRPVLRRWQDAPTPPCEPCAGGRRK